VKTPTSTKAEASAPNKRKFSQRSTATEAQMARIVAALQVGPKTTDDLRAMGIFQTSARIFGLRARGLNITTELYDGYSADGYSHARMARYRLLDGPGDLTKPRLDPAPVVSDGQWSQ
jgi:hypothetical protein